MPISARIVEDTKAPNGVRITTMELRYPKFIHGELMTHRVFSRNASSSRAVPTKKLLAQVRTEPAGPVEWGKNQSGMQAREVFAGGDAEKAAALWQGAAIDAARYSEEMMELGLHKQIANRVTEPFAYIHVIVTSTKWANFFGLRCDPDAQPEMKELGWLMADEFYCSVPRRLENMDFPDDVYARSPEDWHLPYVSLEERIEIGTGMAVRASTARCARVSYMNHDGTNPDLEKDASLHGMLFEQRHMSPFEHQATPARSELHQSRNFHGWIQARELIRNDTRKFDYLASCREQGREPKHQKFEWWNR